MQKLLDSVSDLLQTAITVQCLYSSVWEPFTARGRPLEPKTVGKAKQEEGGW